MFKIFQSRVFWGLILILAGTLFLLQNLLGFQFGNLFWAVALGVGGLLFISVYLGNRQMWWGLIPGITLLGIASLVFLDTFAAGFTNVWGGSIVLGSIALAFVFVYLADRSNWWAVIPGGVMLTLALVAGLDSLMGGMDTGGVFFLGLGLTFAVVALLPTPHGQMKWAWIPAGILLGFGILLSASAGTMIRYLGPIALILGGGYLVLRNMLSRGN
jgi:hypothetical protein